MLNIRLNRVGRKNKAYFRVVVQEHTVAPGGRHVEVLGSYDPHAKQAVLKTDRIAYWLSQGAQLSDTMHNLLVREGVIEGKKISVKMKRPVKAEAVAEEVKAETPKAEVAA
ncbi:MAG: 30S ribosomal protein S16 [Candidatus Moraniibacteriota bacterium]